MDATQNCNFDYTRALQFWPQLGSDLQLRTPLRVPTLTTPEHCNFFTPEHLEFLAIFCHLILPFLTWYGRNFDYARALNHWDLQFRTLLRFAILTTAEHCNFFAPEHLEFLTQLLSWNLSLNLTILFNVCSQFWAPLGAAILITPEHCNFGYNWESQLRPPLRLATLITPEHCNCGYHSNLHF